ncbi:MAG TPA: polyprenyl synthetase family protein [Longimicrobiaceae bacterium]|nr:polyprenyl synthetase family protein [Longimicrobiaceae bacterium]
MLRTAPPRLSEIQAPVRERLDTVFEEIRRIVVADFGMVAEVNDHLLKVRGKLFRPTLTLLCNEVGGRPGSDAATLAAVLELVHLATLVHDDAVDHSVLRRGMPTVNSVWSHQVAVIMGDYLYTRALTEITRLGEVEPIRVLATAANAMTVGEMRQLASHDALDFGQDDYFRLIDSKTASLMSAACELGALAGDPDLREPLAQFGRELGMAFQIADDLLDYTADEAVTGKPTGIDLREHKVTLPLIAVLPELSAAERDEVDALFRDPEPDDARIAAVVRIVRGRGGLDYARGTALEYARRAEEALEGLPEGPALDALRTSIAYAIERRR